MKILTHFQNITLTPDQEKALENLSSFLKSNDHIFILRGYAGTGKTTLIKGILEYLENEKKQVKLMAPTGRAAKILRDKTGKGQTIHKSIYNFEDLRIEKDEDLANNSLHYIFPINHEESDNQIFIVDEASMISSRESKNELFSFGSNVLLADLLTFSRIPNTQNKIIFVGDPAQLPPVEDNESKALKRSYFEKKGINAQEFELTTVMRQNNNAILQNAFKLRDLIGKNGRTQLSLEEDKDSFLKIPSEEIATKYTELFPIPNIGQGVIIAFSNNQCLQYNLSVREKIFPECKTVTVDDLLIINQNNYHTYGTELMNGEIVKTMQVSPTIITRKNIPVYVIQNGKRVKKHVSFDFREVKIRKEKDANEIDCLIIDNLLNSPYRDLSITEMKALYIDFVMRFRDRQANRENQGLRTNEIGSEEFRNQLRGDRFFNALRVKYGYAITCHKAQGGEWDKVFIDYYGRTSLKDDPLRWAYTATTRAVKICYASNEPYVSIFSRFQINEIQPLTNIPRDARSFKNVPISPFHNENQHRSKSFKFWGIEEKLQESPFQVKSVASLGGFQERYTISYQDEEAQFDSHHNNAGIFRPFQVVRSGPFDWIQDVLKLLNEPYQSIFNVDYKPSLPILKKLNGIIQLACSENDVSITNIVERANNYFVVYYFKTDAPCALIQFYFNNNEQITRAIPKSPLGEDESLNQIIEKIKDYAI